MNKEADSESRNVRNERERKLKSLVFLDFQFPWPTKFDHICVSPYSADVYINLLQTKYIT